MVRIAHGRDAADIAFLTTAGACELTDHMVSVSLAETPKNVKNPVSGLDKASHNPNTVEEAA